MRLLSFWVADTGIQNFLLEAQSKLKTKSSNNWQIPSLAMSVQAVLTGNVILAATDKKKNIDKYAKNCTDSIELIFS